MKAIILLSLFSMTLLASGLNGLDANKFRWAETYLDEYKKTSGNTKSSNQQKVKSYIIEIQDKLDNNKADSEYAKYKARLDKLIAVLKEDTSRMDIPKDITTAKSNLYWAQGKIDYAFQDSYYGATETNLKSAEGYLENARDILFSGKYEDATGEYKVLLDLYKKLKNDLAKLNHYNRKGLKK